MCSLARRSLRRISEKGPREVELPFDEFGLRRVVAHGAEIGDEHHSTAHWNERARLGARVIDRDRRAATVDGLKVVEMPSAPSRIPEWKWFHAVEHTAAVRGCNACRVGVSSGVLSAKAPSSLLESR